MHSLSEIKSEVDRLAKRVRAPESLLPTYGHTRDAAHPHIEVDEGGYHYVIVERGEELRRVTTDDLDQLLYFVFEGVTFSLACDYAARHRAVFAVFQDFRRPLFRRQIELLSMISPAWAETESKEQERILKQHPFDDSLTHS
jgi:hypothetical protein